MPKADLDIARLKQALIRADQARANRPVLPTGPTGPSDPYADLPALLVPADYTGEDGGGSGDGFASDHFLADAAYQGRDRAFPSAPHASTEEEYLRSLSPVDAIKFGRQLQNARVYSPEEAAANRAQTFDAIQHVTPIIGNLAAGQDAYDYAKEAGRLARAGDMNEARKNMAMAGLSTLGMMFAFPVGNSVAREATQDVISGSRMAAGRAGK